MSTTTTYKNVSEAGQTLVGFGVIAAGETVATDQEINHPAFKQVEPDDHKEVKGKKKEVNDGK